MAAVAGRRPYADCPHPLRPLADGRDSLPAARHPARGGGADRRLHGSCVAAAGHRTQWDTWPNPPRDPRCGWLGARAPARGVGRQRWKRHGDDRVKLGEKPSTGKSRCTCWNPHRHTVQAVIRSRVETLSSHLSPEVLLEARRSRSHPESPEGLHRQRFIAMISRRHRLPQATVTSIQPELWVEGRSGRVLRSRIRCNRPSPGRRAGRHRRPTRRRRGSVLGGGTVRDHEAARPRAIDGATSRTLLVVEDPDSVVQQAVAAGATESSP